MDEQRPVEGEFSSMVAGLAASAMAVLSQVEILLQPGAISVEDEAKEGESKPLPADEREKLIRDGLASIRQLVDTLVVLEQKTKGNLTDDEAKLLEGAVSELRIGFVELANRPIPTAREAEGDAE